MMSIDQEWFSTMFGVQFTVSSLIGAGALMLVITGIFRFKLTEYQIGSKLTFDFVSLELLMPTYPAECSSRMELAI